MSDPPLVRSSVFEKIVTLLFLAASALASGLLALCSFKLVVVPHGSVCMCSYY
jgi:hypothetical protein